LLPNGTNCPNFVNADLIAVRSNPLNPERAAIAAGRIMISMIDDHVIRGSRL
jgi:predicted ABC-type ATPase